MISGGLRSVDCGHFSTETNMKSERIEFWSGKSYAVVGVSDKKGKFANTIFKELKKRGYKLLPVNRNLKLFDDQMCYNSLSEISEPLYGVVIITGPGGAKKAVRECINMGIKKVWLYPGSKCDEAINLARENDLKLIHKACPLLYLEPVKFPHSLHRWIAKVFGKL
jgi:predicted CoA-binding protein